MIDEKEGTIQFQHVADRRFDVLHSTAFHAQVRRSPYSEPPSVDLNLDNTSINICSDK
jgi:hypothetical protein